MAAVLPPAKCIYFIMGHGCDISSKKGWHKIFTDTIQYDYAKYAGTVFTKVFCPPFIRATYNITEKRLCELPSKDKPFVNTVYKEINDDLTSGVCTTALIIGFSHGGLIASMVAGMFAGNPDMKDRVRVITLGSIYTPVISGFDILHIMYYGDVAFSCNRLKPPVDKSSNYYDPATQVFYMQSTKKKQWDIHNDYFKTYILSDKYIIRFCYDFLIPFFEGIPFIGKIDPIKDRTFSNNEEELFPDSTPPSNSLDPTLSTNPANNAGAKEAKRQQAALLVNLPKLPSSLWFGRNTHKKSYYRTIKPVVVQKLAVKLSENNVDNVRIQSYLQMPEFLEFLINLLRYLRKYHDIDKLIDEKAAAEIADAFFLEGAFTIQANGSHVFVDSVSKLISFIKDRLINIADTIIKRDSEILKPAILQITVDYVIDLLTMLTEWRNRWSIDTYSFKTTDINKLKAIYGVLDLKQRANLETAIHKFTEAMTKPMSHNAVTDRRNSNINAISPKPSELTQLQARAPWIANFGGSRRKIHKRKRKTHKRR